MRRIPSHGLSNISLCRYLNFCVRFHCRATATKPQHRGASRQIKYFAGDADGQAPGGLEAVGLQRLMTDFNTTAQRCVGFTSLSWQDNDFK